jgi:hypothetical protein
MSSAVYGATRLRSTATASTPSRTAGSAGPTAGSSIALRRALTSSIVRATATLNFSPSTRVAASETTRWVMRRSGCEPAAGSAPTGEVTSPARRHALARNRAEPAGETSAQSTSSSAGREDHREPDRVDPVGVQLLAQPDQVALGLAHGGPVHLDHALVEQTG